MVLHEYVRHLVTREKFKSDDAYDMKDEEFGCIGCEPPCKFHRSSRFETKFFKCYSKSYCKFESYANYGSKNSGETPEHANAKIFIRDHINQWRFIFICELCGVKDKPKNKSFPLPCTAKCEKKFENRRPDVAVYDGKSDKQYAGIEILKTHRVTKQKRAEIEHKLPGGLLEVRAIEVIKQHDKKDFNIIYRQLCKNCIEDLAIDMSIDDEEMKSLPDIGIPGFGAKDLTIDVEMKLESIAMVDEEVKKESKLRNDQGDNTDIWSTLLETLSPSSAQVPIPVPNLQSDSVGIECKKEVKKIKNNNRPCDWHLVWNPYKEWFDASVLHKELSNKRSKYYWMYCCDSCLVKRQQNIKKCHFCLTEANVYDMGVRQDEKDIFVCKNCTCCINCKHPITVSQYSTNKPCEDCIMKISKWENSVEQLLVLPPTTLDACHQLQRLSDDQPCAQDSSYFVKNQQWIKTIIAKIMNNLVNEWKVEVKRISNQTQSLDQFKLLLELQIKLTSFITSDEHGACMDLIHKHCTETWCYLAKKYVDRSDSMNVWEVLSKNVPYDQVQFWNSLMPANYAVWQKYQRVIR